MITSNHHTVVRSSQAGRARLRRLAAVLAAGATVIAACGGSDDDAGASVPATADEATTATEPVGEPDDATVASTGAADPDAETGDEAAETTTTTEAPPATDAPTTTVAEDDPFDEILERVGEPTARYDDASLWVCRGSSTDPACTTDLSVTMVDADGNAEVVERVAATDPAADCFYVYPTVDGRMEPGNTSLSEPLDPELRATIELVTGQQAAPFSPLCRVFVPLHEQVTFGTYDLFGTEPPDLRSEPFDIAYQQVLDAFRWYMFNENGGRPIVLLGHSQGAQHLARLTGELFDGDPELTDQLAVAALVGGGGYGINVASGELVGGTLGTVPLCSDLAGSGCVVAYNSYLVDTPPNNWIMDGPPGTEAACVNPAELATGSTTVTASIFDYPVIGSGQLVSDISGVGLGDVSTRFVGVEGAYEATCVSDGTKNWLEITSIAASGARPEIPLPNAPGIGLGLHGVDYQLMAGDLLVLVEAKTATAAGDQGG